MVGSGQEPDIGNTLKSPAWRWVFSEAPGKSASRVSHLQTQAAGPASQHRSDTKATTIRGLGRDVSHIVSGQHPSPQTDSTCTAL